MNLVLIGRVISLMILGVTMFLLVQESTLTADIAFIGEAIVFIIITYSDFGFKRVD